MISGVIGSSDQADPACADTLRRCGQARKQVLCGLYIAVTSGARPEFGENLARGHNDGQVDPQCTGPIAARPAAGWSKRATVVSRLPADLTAELTPKAPDELAVDIVEHVVVAGAPEIADESGSDVQADVIGAARIWLDGKKSLNGLIVSQTGWSTPSPAILICRQTAPNGTS